MKIAGITEQDLRPHVTVAQKDAVLFIYEREDIIA